MSARLNARDRLARLLSVIPWVADQPDGVPIDDIVARFAYPEHNSSRIFRRSSSSSECTRSRLTP